MSGFLDLLDPIIHFVSFIGNFTTSIDPGAH
jgi:hypothetical protein